MTKKTVRKMVQQESNGLDWQYIRLQQERVQTEALKPFGVDSFGALAVSFDSMRWLVAVGGGGGGGGGGNVVAAAVVVAVVILLLLLLLLMSLLFSSSQIVVAS